MTDVCRDLPPVGGDWLSACFHQLRDAIHRLIGIRWSASRGGLLVRLSCRLTDSFEHTSQTAAGLTGYQGICWES